MKITLSRQEILAALLFASQDENRYAICGLCVKYRPGRTPVAVATDGRRLAVIESTAEQDFDIARLNADDALEPEQNEREITIQGGFLKAICALNKAVCGKLFPWITFQNRQGSERLMVSMPAAGLFLEAEKGSLIDQPFPNWKTCVPSRRAQREPVSALGMNAEFVGDFAKAAKLFNRDIPQIQMSLVGKDQVIEISIPGVPNFYGLFMPIKADDDKAEFQPEFLGIVEQLPPPPVKEPPAPVEKESELEEVEA